MGKKISFFKSNRIGVDGAWNMLKVSEWKLFVEFYSPYSTQVVSNCWCGWFHATHSKMTNSTKGLRLS